jgi:cytochrome c peroxidase
MNRIALAFLWLLLLLACGKETLDAPDAPILLQVPAGFPAPVFPEDNAFTPERWALGKQLFFDPIMSRDSTVSCASCHLPQHAFSDVVALSLGVENRPGRRNAPTLANVAYHPYFTREGGVPTLEMQIAVPVQEHDEFDFNIVLIAERLARNPGYAEASRKAYNRAPDAFVITRALATFERSMLSGNSPYDKAAQGLTTLSPAQQRGQTLFFSERLACTKCHNGFDLSSYAFENNGLYESYDDPGRYRLTGLETDKARFKVPTLSNIAVTAPYMHDGRFATLEEVLEHYNTGVKHSSTIDPLMQFNLNPGLGLTQQDMTDIIAFLQTLTDLEFVRNPEFNEP